jgi:predicted MFS family arabinose efflux permease
VDAGHQTIVGDLGGLSHLSWVVTAYLLATTVSAPLWGKLGDQYGRKTLFQAAIVIFLIGSALCGVSQDMFELRRWVFYINLPVGIIALAVIAVALPSSRERRKHSVDYAGTVLLAGAATCVVLATS